MGVVICHHTHSFGLAFKNFYSLTSMHSSSIIHSQQTDHRESKRLPEKHLLLLHWLCKSLWLCESQETGKFLQKQEYNHLTCLLRNLFAGQEATIRTGHGTTDWFKLGKEYNKAVYCHPAYLPYMQSTS